MCLNVTTYFCILFCNGKMLQSVIFIFIIFDKGAKYTVIVFPCTQNWVGGCFSIGALLLGFLSSKNFLKQVFLWIHKVAVDVVK